MNQRHFLDLSDFDRQALKAILDGARTIKTARVRGQKASNRPLEGKTLAMIFDKPSTRTRVSFDVGMRELGGETLMLTGAEMQLGRGETIADTAREARQLPQLGGSLMNSPLLNSRKFKVMRCVPLGEANPNSR